MEEAVRELAERYDRVLVRNKNKLHAPIRLRRKLLADLHPRIVMSQPAFNAERDAWNEEGGILIYDRAYNKDYEKLESHQAQFISECPMSLQDLDDFTECTHEVVVIYKPGAWRGHEHWIDLTYPPAAMCRPVYESMMSGEPRPVLSDLLGFREGFCVRTDEDVAAECKVPLVQVKRVRRRLFRPHKMERVAEVVPRVSPPDEHLAKIYDFVMRCPQLGGSRLIVPRVMVAECSRMWQVALRALVRCGAIVRKPDLYLYWPETLGPNWKKVQSWHEQYRRRLQEMAAFMETTSEFVPYRENPKKRVKHFLSP